MKRLWFAISVILLLSVLCGVHLTRLDRLTGQLIRQVEQVDDCLYRDDWEGARAGAQQIYRQWEAAALYLHTTLHHQDIDAIRTSIRESLAYLNIGEDKAECLSVNARLVNQLELLLEAEQPSLKNLM